MQIEIEVTGQKIKRLNSPGSVADTINYLTCHFIFVGEEWDNTVRTAHFENQKSGERYAQIIADDGTCTVPWEALTDKGFVRFSVAGERDDYRITTDIESFYNGETVYGGEPSEPPTPSQYDQLIALAEQTKEIAESVREDADAGEFDGEPGKPGAPGRDGVSPTAKVDETNDGAVITVTDATGTTTAKLKNGKDGNPGQDATDEQVQAAVEAYMEEHPIQGDAEDIIKLAIKNEASGAVPIVTTDSAEMGVQDLTMQGWTEQAQYEGKNLFDLNGVEYNKMINVLNGTISDNDGYSVSPYIPVKPNTIYSRTYNSISGNVLYDSEKQYISNVAGGGTIRTTENAAYLRFNLPNNVSYAEATVVNEGSILLEWEPYTGSAPSPSPDYPQPITNAGKYNEDTQKWEYEITITNAQTDPDKEQTVTLTADRPLTKWDRLEKRNGQWGWVYKSNRIEMDGNETGFGENYLPILVFGTVPTGVYTDRGSSVKPRYDIWSNYTDILTWSNVLLNSVCLNLDNSGLSNIGVNSSETFKQWLAQKYSEGNPFYYEYETDAETFVPLAASEQEQMNALYTYYPTTVLSNDTECEMSIKYIADTKTYIDSKIAAIQAAVVNTI